MKNKKNKKVGIITLYYNNFNFGGALQAYALCRVVNSMGYEAEQITYHKTKEKSLSEIKRKINFLSINTIFVCLKNIVKKIVYQKKIRKYFLR